MVLITYNFLNFILAYKLICALTKISRRKRELQDKKQLASDLIKSLKTDVFKQKRKELQETKHKLKREIRILTRLATEANIFLQAMGH